MSWSQRGGAGKLKGEMLSDPLLTLEPGWSNGTVFEAKNTHVSEMSIFFSG